MMIKMKVLPEPVVTMTVGTEIIEDTTEIDRLNQQLETAETKNTVYYEELGDADVKLKSYGVGGQRKKENGVWLPVVADNIPLVYQAGKKSQYDEFWDNFQNYGKRYLYGYAFASLLNNQYYWNETNFKPKYDIIPKGKGDSLFRCMKIPDFSAHLENLGITVDLSQISTFNDGFYYTATDHIGTLDLSNCSSMNYAFWGCSVKTIDKIILRKGTVSVNGTFTNMWYLENLTFEGTIRNNGFNFKSCTKLTKESIENIISVLSPDTTDLTITLSVRAVNNAFETEKGLADGSTSDGWLALIETKSNWVIALS